MAAADHAQLVNPLAGANGGPESTSDSSGVGGGNGGGVGLQLRPVQPLRLFVATLELMAARLRRGYGGVIAAPVYYPPDVTWSPAAPPFSPVILHPAGGWMWGRCGDSAAPRAAGSEAVAARWRSRGAPPPHTSPPLSSLPPPLPRPHPLARPRRELDAALQIHGVRRAGRCGRRAGGVPEGGARGQRGRVGHARGRLQPGRHRGALPGARARQLSGAAGVSGALRQRRRAAAARRWSNAASPAVLTAAGDSAAFNAAAARWRPSAAVAASIATRAMLKAPFGARGPRGARARGPRHAHCNAEHHRGSPSRPAAREAAPTQRDGTPLVEAVLDRALRREEKPFHVPGHKVDRVRAMPWAGGCPPPAAAASAPPPPPPAARPPTPPPLRPLRPPPRQRGRALHPAMRRLLEGPGGPLAGDLTEIAGGCQKGGRDGGAAGSEAAAGSGPARLRPRPSSLCCSCR
jgi:hypothetical protein